MFEHDLFISYAHIDNKPFNAEQGWIDRLHERLAIRLPQILGEELVIWRDPKLQGNDLFADTLLIELTKVALFVSVVSPRYLKSEWCLNELRAFHEHAQRSGGVYLRQKARIFKVLKTPVGLKSHPLELQAPLPLELQGPLGYQFYELDPTRDRFREFGYEDGPNRDQRYWNQLENLAQDIAKLIAEMKATVGTEVQPRVPPSGKTVYLAETTSDRNLDRDGIRRELLLNGHRVVPDRELSPNRRWRDEVNNYLAESSLAVHLIGADYGIVPEGAARSIIQLQHELAAERAGAADFTQLVWLPNELQATDERQQKFIDELLNHSNLTARTELLREKLEDLKTFIQHRLKPLTPAQKPHHNGNDSRRAAPVVYIACDQPDYDAVTPIADYLHQRGLNFLDPASDPQTHKDCLLSCDAILTYCGRTTDGWLNLKKMELIKLPGYGRATPLLAQAFYISAPQTSGKERFRIQDGLVIKNYGDFFPASLDPFIEQIEQAKGARS